MGWFSDLFAEPTPPPCPKCGTPMEGKGQVAGAFGVEMINFTHTLYQCPGCRNIEVGVPDVPTPEDPPAHQRGFR